MHRLDLAVAVGLIVAVLSASAFLLPVSLGPRVVLEPLLITRGLTLYHDIVDQHEPLLPILVSLFVRCGISPVQSARATLLLLMALSMGGLFILSTKFLPGRVALALFFYAAATPLILGGKLWYDMAMAPFLLAATVLLLGVIQSTGSAWRVWLAGALLGCAFLVKQHAALVVVAVAVWIVADLGWPRAKRLLPQFLAAFVFLPATHLLWLAWHHALLDYLQWCWFLDRRFFEQAALLPVYRQLLEVLPLALLVVTSLALCRSPEFRLLAAVGLSASLFVYPRYAQFHFGAALPFLALMAACTAARLLDRFRAGPVTAAATALLLALLIGWGRSPRFGSRGTIEEYDHLTGAAQLLRDRLPGGGRIAIFPEDETTANLHVSSGCLPPDYLVLTYPWYVDDRVEDRLIDGLSRCDRVVLFPGRAVDGVPPEQYMSRYYAEILREFPESEHVPIGKMGFWIRRRAGDSARER